MFKYQDDFTYYYFDNNELKIATVVSEIPEHINEWMTISDAVGYVRKIGCMGQHIHNCQKQSTKLALAVLRIAIYKYGQMFDKVYRGSKSSRPLSEYKLIFASPSREVAEFYGEVTELTNIRGLLTRSMAKSVVTDDYSQVDEEILFFPQ